MDKPQAVAKAECAVRIAVRQRPLSAAEKAAAAALSDEGSENGENFIQRAGAMDDNIIIVGDRPFVFDAILDGLADQEDLFARLVAPMVDKLLSGFYCTVLAYGQTGTGKSYTMGLHSESFIEDMSGIVPRVLANLFDRRSSATDDTSDTQIFVSFVEIYNERVFDLLSDQSADPVNTKGHKFIGGNQQRVHTLQEAQLVLVNGNQNRHVRPTKMNAQSSRSHAIFTVHATVRRADDRRTESAMHLVDLAGSEGVRRTGHQGAALTEGVHINQGLLSIGKVLQALSVGNKVIPYRDSVLSSVLQDSLNHNSYLTLLACISPLRDDASETLSTLRFAQSAKSLRHTPQVNAIISEIKKTRTPSKVKTPKKHLSSAPSIASPLRPRGVLAKTPRTVTAPLAASTTFKRRPVVSMYRKSTMYTPNKNHNATVIAAKDISRLNRAAMNGAASVLSRRPSVWLPDASQMFLDVSTSTTVADQSHREPPVKPVAAPDSSSYSPIIRRCMQEVTTNFNDQIRNIMLGMQNNGTFCQQHHTTGRAVADDTKTKDDLKLTVAEETANNSFEVTSIRRLTRQSMNSLADIENKPIDSDLHLVATFDPNSTITLLPAAPVVDDLFRMPAVPHMPKAIVPMRRSTRRRMTIDEIPAQAPARTSARISMRRQTLVESPVVPKTVPRKSTQVRDTKKDKILAQLTGAQTMKQAKNLQHSFVLNMFNTGSMKDLQILPQIGPKMAYQIITYRTTHGKLKSIEDMAQMPIWRGRGWERFETVNCLK